MGKPGLAQGWGGALLGVGGCIFAFALTISLPLMTAGCMLALIGLFLSGRSIAKWPLYGALVMAAWMALSQWLNNIADWKLGTAYTILAWPVMQAIAQDHRWRRRVLIALSCGVIASCSLALLQFLWGYDRAQRPFAVGTWGEAPRLARVSGFFTMHLSFSYALASVLLLASCPSRTWGVPRWLWWTTRAFAGFGVLASQARSGLLGLIAGMAVRLSSGGGWLRSALMALLMLLVAGGFLLIVNPNLARQSTGESNPRWVIWSLGGQIAGDHWLLGTGGRERFAPRYQQLLREQHPLRARAWDPEHPDEFYAQWPELKEHAFFQKALSHWQLEHLDEETRASIAEQMDYHFGIITGNALFFPEGAPHPHNSVLGLIARFGTPSLLIWLSLLTVVGVQAWRARRHAPEAAGVAGGAIALALVAGLFEDFANDSQAGYALWLVCGLALGVLQSSAKEAQQRVGTTSHPHATATEPASPE